MFGTLSALLIWDRRTPIGPSERGDEKEKDLGCK